MLLTIMMRYTFSLCLACSLILATGINPVNRKFSLQAATIKKPQALRYNRANLNHYAYHGQKGTSGRSGQDQKITIDGSSINLDLSGTDGRDGERGGEGFDARCGSIDIHGKSEIKLADGGNGGNGGNGGHGGHGGLLTVVYSQIEHLKQLKVLASGGLGGRGAEGGRNGRGCICPFQIFGSINHKSDRKEIHCHNGKDGRYGNHGRDGEDGRNGTLYLVQQGKDLRPDNPTATISLSSISQNQPIDLSNNIWQSHNGAVSLLHPGSIVADTYQEYIKRLDKIAVVKWQESRPINDFEDQDLGLELTENNQILITYPENVWLDIAISEEEKQALLTINNAVAEEEATRLTRGLISGNRSNLIFTAIDQARKSDILQTQFKIKYRTSNNRFADERRFGSYKTRYEGIIPASAISKDGQRFSLALGQLPIDNKYLLPGTSVKIELTIIRSLDKNSAEQKIQWEGEISKSAN